MSGQLGAGRSLPPPPLTRSPLLLLSLAARCSASSGMDVSGVRVLSAPQRAPWAGQARAAWLAAAVAPRVVQSGHAAAARQPARQRSSLAAAAAAAASSSDSGEQAGSMPDGGHAATPVGSEQPMMVKRRKDGKLMPVTQELTVSLTALAKLCGAKPAAVATAAAKLYRPRQEQLLHSGPEVAAYLRELGIEEPQLARLLERCPELFSWPLEKRAAVLFGQLMELELSVAEAARCLENEGAVARATSFEAGIAVLEEVLVGCGEEELEQTGRQVLKELLLKQPQAVILLQRNPEDLREHLESLQATLHKELGAPCTFLLKLLKASARLLSALILQLRARALVKALGRTKALGAVTKSAQLLTVNTVLWRRAFAVSKLCGVASLVAVAVKNAGVLAYDWLAPGPLANRLALQRRLRLSAADVYKRHAGYIFHTKAERLVGRLLYLEERGLGYLVVATKGPARRAWLQERGLTLDRFAPDEPTFISIGSIANLSDKKFSALLVELGCGTAAGFAAFQAGLLD